MSLEGYSYECLCFSYIETVFFLLHEYAINCHKYVVCSFLRNLDIMALAGN